MASGSKKTPNEDSVIVLDEDVDEDVVAVEQSCTKDARQQQQKVLFAVPCQDNSSAQYPLWSEFPLTKHTLSHTQLYPHNSQATTHFYTWLSEWSEKISRMKGSGKAKSKNLTGKLDSAVTKSPPKREKGQKSLMGFFKAKPAAEKKEPANKKKSPAPVEESTTTNEPAATSTIPDIEIHHPPPPPVNPESKKKTPAKKKKVRNDDEEFQLSDESDDYAQMRSSGKTKRRRVPNPAPLIVLTGPVASGKTHCVYQCAAELGFSVFELNNTSNLTRNYIVQVVGEITQSHSFTAKNSRTLLLFEHVDLLDTQGLDAGFFSGLNTLRESTKRPIVLTCNDTTFLEELGQKFNMENDVVYFKTLQDSVRESTQSTVSDLRKFAKDFCHSEGITFSKDIDMLCHLVEGDTRKLLLLLQFWYQHDRQDVQPAKSNKKDNNAKRSPLLRRVASEEQDASSENTSSHHHLCEKYLGMEQLTKFWANALKNERTASTNIAPLKHDLLSTAHLHSLHQTFIAHLREDGDIDRCSRILNGLSEIDLMNAQREREQETVNIDLEMHESEATMLCSTVQDVILGTSSNRTYDPKDSSVQYATLGSSGCSLLHLDVLCIEDHIRLQLNAAHEERARDLASFCMPYDVRPTMDDVHGIVCICMSEAEKRATSKKRRFHHHFQSKYTAEEIHELNRIGQGWGV